MTPASLMTPTTTTAQHAIGSGANQGWQRTKGVHQ